MGSNKRHKSEKTRDVKRKRHRSRSRSVTPEREKFEKSEKHNSGNGSSGNNGSTRHHHKKHRRTKERKDYDSDIEIIEAPPPPKISRPSHPSTPPPPEISRRTSPTPNKGAPVQHLSLSVEETNELRVKLGLKPLNVDTAATNKDDPEKLKDDLGEFYHKPAPNIAEKTKSQAIKEKLNIQKQKRRIEADLAKVKALGEYDSDFNNDNDDQHDDVHAWVEKSRRLQDEKKKAEERAKMLDQLDVEFGIGELVKEEMRGIRNKTYTDKDLKGLKVEHAIDSLAEGKTMILTLKDQGVLEDDKDVLVNVNVMDDERYKRNVFNKTKKSGYDPYDESNLDEFGQPIKEILEKYDEEIQGEKKESFVLGSRDLIERSRAKLNIAKQRLENKRLESLQLPEPKLASEYYNEEELTKFKKLKKKVRKIRKKQLKADDLVPENDNYLRDLGSRRDKRRTENKAESNGGHEVDNGDHDFLDTDDVPDIIDTSGIKLEEDEKEPELQLALRKARRLKSCPSNIQKVVETIKRENDASNENQSGNIVLNATAEFCRTLGDIPTYGLAGNREETGQELMDFEVNEVKDEPRSNEEEDDGRGAWNAVHMDESVSEQTTQEAAILDAEPSLGQGVAGALQLAMSKGYLQKEDNNRPSASRFAHLQAQNYSIEDKTYGDDDKFGRRDRFNGPTSEFKEKDGFKPNVKLEYIDDDGHVLSAKEAFRYLSHKFHGKGPGKNKVEKRMKKAEQEVLMKRMSSTDTPLGTLNLLQAKQKETQSPYIVLSGSKHMQTSISKTKH